MEAAPQERLDALAADLAGDFGVPVTAEGVEEVLALAEGVGSLSFRARLDWLMKVEPFTEGAMMCSGGEYRRDVEGMRYTPPDRPSRPSRPLDRTEARVAMYLLRRHLEENPE